MLFDTLGSGGTEESLSRTFKVETGLSDIDNVIELSRFTPGDPLVEVNEAAKSLMDKLPAFSEKLDEFGFSERCEVTNTQIDGVLEKLEQFRGLPIPQLPPLLAKHYTSPVRRIGGCPENRNRLS